MGERLGRGGMSEVWAATDLRLGRTVAIKFLRDDIDDPAARTRIEAEAKSAARLTHRNIVAVYDAGEHENRPFVVMELADSRSLADLIREEGRLSADQARSVGVQVLAALTAAHAEGIIHRDVKPANILVSEDGSVKLADFGIAKSLSQASAGLTVAGQVMGTPSYLSPEQASGQPAGPRSDLYALGVVLFEALSGRPPYEGDTPLAVVSAHAHAPVPDIRGAVPGGLPESLAAVVERSLSKDPNERYLDAESMAVALEASATQPAPADTTLATAVAAGTTAIPAPTSRTEATSSPTEHPGTAVSYRQNQRNRVPSVAAAALVVLMAALLYFGLRGGDPQTVAEAGAATSQTSLAPPETQAASEETQPARLGLLELLAEDPDSAGEKGSDLRKKLTEVESFSGEKQSKEAAELQEEIAEWVNKGELDPARGREAISYLDRFINREDRGRGNGRDREEDDD